MEWVEKTGKSLEEAKERALEQLGVAETDAEVVVLAEPKTGLFGRTRGEARVRARVRPAEPRPKRRRRPRDRGRSAGGTGSRREGTGSGTRTATATRNDERTNGSRGGSRSANRRRRRRRGSAGGTQKTEGRTQETANAADSRDGVTSGGGDQPEGRTEKESTVAEGVTLQEQGAVAKEFVEGLLARYGLDATIEVRELDESTVEVAAKGDGLGMLVGPKGATLAALQDITRTVVQRHFPNRTDRVVLDVAGYRERRIAALRRFAADVASEVLDSGAERALEPMSPADRKVIHDAVLEIDGVRSSSQGEEPRRFVVISPGS